LDKPYFSSLYPQFLDSTYDLMLIAITASKFLLQKTHPENIFICHTGAIAVYINYKQKIAKNNSNNCLFFATETQSMTLLAR